MEKLKLLIVCHFSNPQIRQKLELSEKHVYADFAVWITNKIKAYEKNENILLNIVSPHKGMKKKTQSFVVNEVNYHFYNAGGTASSFATKALNYIAMKVPAGFLRSVVEFFREAALDMFYSPQKRYVEKLVREIKPDIIHLNGAENPYYSSTVLGLRKHNIPICVLIQGVLNNPAYIASRKHIDQYRIKVEKKIHSLFDYYIVGTDEHYRLVKKDNQKANFFFSPGIRTIAFKPERYSINKKYDFIFFARVEPTKGVEHVLLALSVLKETHDDLKLLVLGPISMQYKTKLLRMCEELDVVENVTIAGSIPLRENLFKKVLEAKIFVLPTLFEGLATSAVEAMLLGLPVVTYATGGMPFLNKDGENVLMSQTGDIKGLISNMERLLVDSAFADKLAKDGQEFAKRVFNEEANMELNLKQYRAIIKHYHNGTLIPADLIYRGGIS